MRFSVSQCARQQVLGLCLLNAAVFPPTADTPKSRIPGSRLASSWWSLQRRLHLNHVLVATSAAGKVVGSVEVHTTEYLRRQSVGFTPEQLDLLQPYLASLAVTPEERGQGIGQALVEAAIKATSERARPKEHLLLQVETGSPAMRLCA